MRNTSKLKRYFALFILLFVSVFSVVKNSHGNESSSYELFTRMPVLTGFITDEIFVGRQKLKSQDKNKLLEILNNPELLITVSDYKSLDALQSIPGIKKVILLQGYNTKNDGGEGYFFIDREAGRRNQDEFDGALVIRTGESGTVLRRIHSGSLDIRAAGAIGDGVHDDTIPVQSILDTRFNVFTTCEECVFLVGPRKDSKGVYKKTKSALVIYADQKLNLQGATLRLKDNSNVTLLANEALHVEGTADRGIHIMDVVFDGNVSNQKIHNIGKHDALSPTVYLLSINNSVLKNIVVKNYYGIGILITFREGHFSRKVKIDEISINKGLVAGMVIWGEEFDIGKIEITGTRPFMEGDVPVYYWGVHPNSFAAQLYKSKIESIVFRDCSWGFKLQGGSTDVRIGEIVADGVRDIQAVKFQGIDDKRGYRPNDDIVVESVISSNNNYNGLFIVNNKNLRIKKYTGNNNGLNYKARLDKRHLNILNFYDVLIIKSDAVIDEIESSNSEVGVVYSHKDGQHTSRTRRFGKIIVRSGGMSNVVSVRDSSNEIGVLDIDDKVSNLKTVVYFERVPPSANKTNVVKTIRVGHGAIKSLATDKICDGSGAYTCMHIIGRDTKLPGIIDGSPGE